MSITPGNSFYEAAVLILFELGVDAPSAAQVNMLVAWEWVEKPHPNGALQWNNPLNTSLRLSGSQTVNSEGVQSYPTLMEGMAACAATIANGDYPTILQALKSGNTSLFCSSAALREFSVWAHGYLSSPDLSYGESVCAVLQSLPPPPPEWVSLAGLVLPSPSQTSPALISPVNVVAELVAGEPATVKSIIANVGGSSGSGGDVSGALVTTGGATVALLLSQHVGTLAPGALADVTLTSDRPIPLTYAGQYLTVVVEAGLGAVSMTSLVASPASTSVSPPPTSPTSTSASPSPTSPTFVPSPIAPSTLAIAGATALALGGGWLVYRALSRSS